MGIDLILFLQQLVVFIVFAFIFNKYFVKNLMSLLSERQKKIDESLDYAEKMKDEYAKIELKAKEEISKAQKESLLIIEKTKASALKEAEKIKTEASREAQKIIETSKKNLENEKAELQRSIQGYVSSAVQATLEEIAIKASQKEIEESVTNAIDNLKV